MKQFQVNPIGWIRVKEEGIYVEVAEEYRPALRELEEFSHINVLWWFDGCDFEDARRLLEVESPYKNAPETMGIFSTRSPARPNPIALSVSQLICINQEKGILWLGYIDANDGSPVLDLKPYTPSLDRVESPTVPRWCSHWPKSLETSGDFDWEEEFNF